MAFDPITETVAHFIGVFDLADEAARSRAEYDRIRAEKAEEREAERLELNAARVKPAHTLEGFDPEGGYRAPPAESVESDIAVLLAARPIAAPLPQIAPPAPIQLPLETVVAGFAVSTVELTLQPPGSVAAVIHQTNHLSDDDLFGFGDGPAPDPVQIVTLLEEVDAALAARDPLTLDLSGPEEGWFAAFQDLIAADVAVPFADAGPITVDVLTGLDAVGAMVVDGVAVDELPRWEDFAPKALGIEPPADDDEEDAGNGDDAQQTSTAVVGTAETHDFSRDFGDRDGNGPGGEKHDGGVQIVGGSNVMVNAATLFSDWIDAKVFVVGGNVLSYDGISQTNLLLDHDWIPAAARGAGEGGSSASDAVNAAAITVRDALVQDDADADAREEAASPGGPPLAWAVTTLAGDLTQFNWVDQYSFATDNDRAEVTVSGSEFHLALGGNEILNAIDLVELGFRYDVIVVDGDYLAANVIKQTNILIDSDRITVAGDDGAVGPDAGDLATGAGADGDAAAGIGLAGVAADGPSADGPDGDGAADGGGGMAVLLDAVAALDGGPVDPIDGAGSAVEADAAGHASPDGGPDDPDGDVAEAPPGMAAGRGGDAPEEAGGFSASDNLQFNRAEIHKVGEDVTAAIDDAYADLASDIREGVNAVSDAVLSDPVFDGAEVLRVLHIAGDLKTVNVVNQTNVLGDADQVHLAADGFSAALREEIEFTVGSNMQLNLAEITNAGIASQIKTNGEVYSDALIHQAELVDSSAMPDGGDIAALAEEAVAFLADGMIGADPGDAIAAAANASIDSAFGASDVMQQMLA